MNGRQCTLEQWSSERDGQEPWGTHEHRILNFQILYYCWKRACTHNNSVIYETVVTGHPSQILVYNDAPWYVATSELPTEAWLNCSWLQGNHGSLNFVLPVIHIFLVLVKLGIRNDVFCPYWDHWLWEPGRRQLQFFPGSVNNQLNNVV